MKPRRPFHVLTLALLATVTACGLPNRVGYRGNVPGSPDEALHRYADEVHLAHLDRDPELRARMGYPWARLWLGRRDPERVASERRQLKRELTQLTEAHQRSRLDQEGLLEWRLLGWTLPIEREALDWSNHEALPRPETGPHLALIEELANFTVLEEEDAREWIEASKEVAEAFRFMTRDVERLSAEGLLARRDAYLQVADECRQSLQGYPFEDSGQESSLYTAFIEGLGRADGVDDSSRARWTDEAEETLRGVLSPAIARYALSLEELASSVEEDRGVWSLPDGKKYYSFLVRRATGSSAPARLIEERTRQLVASARNELEQLARQLDHPGTIQSLLELTLDVQPSIAPDTADPRFLHLLDAAAGAAGDVLPNPATVELTLGDSPAQAGTYGHYARPDGRHRKALWIPGSGQAPGSRRVPLALQVHRMTWPGRHLRESLLATRTDLSGFRRNLAEPAWSGGWDLYALRIAEEIGLTEDPHEVVARVAEDLWAGGLALADFGVHERRWTPGEAREWLQRTTMQPSAVCEKAVAMILQEPGAAVAAAWGLCVILDQRKRAERSLGEDFDLRRFQALLIGEGPLPSDFIVARVSDWLEDGS